MVKGVSFPSPLGSVVNLELADKLSFMKDVRFPNPSGNVVKLQQIDTLDEMVEYKK